MGIDIEESNNADGSKFSWLYIICFFSKFAEGIAMNRKTAGDVITALKASTAWKAGITAQLTGDDNAAFVNSNIFRCFLTEEGVDWKAKDAQHHEGVIKRGVATFKRVLEAKLVKGAKGRAALHGASGAVNRGHVASSTGFTPHLT